MQTLLETDVLRTFLSIAETGSFSAAAISIGRTPSAVSMQMKKLEQQLERDLFIRQGRGVVLSTDGEEMVSYARRILHINEEAVAHFTQPHLEGAVRIGTADDFATRFLPIALAKFARAYPKVQVEVVCDLSVNLIPQVERGLLDMTLVSQTNTLTHITRGIPIWRERLVWAVHEDGQAAERRPLPLALCPGKCAWRASALRALDEADIDYHIAYTSTHYAGQQAAIVADLALAPMPRSLIEPPLRVLEDDEGLPTLEDYEVRLLRAPGKKDPVLDTLATHIVDSFSETLLSQI
ncbi:MAG: LysR family transcriptional regulator [Rhizobiales bacterium]|nr:LysR family transcriptional regulator [Hyphomicrobiales bacterium]